MGIVEDFQRALNGNFARSHNLLPSDAPDMSPGAGEPVRLVTPDGDFGIDPSKPARAKPDTLDAMVREIRDLLRNHFAEGTGGGATGAIPRRITLAANVPLELVPRRMNRGLPVLVRVLSGGPVLVNAGVQPTVDDFPLAVGDRFEYHADEALYGWADVASVVVTWAEV